MNANPVSTSWHIPSPRVFGRPHAHLLVDKHVYTPFSYVQACTVSYLYAIWNASVALKERLDLPGGDSRAGDVAWLIALEDSLLACIWARISKSLGLVIQ